VLCDRLYFLPGAARGFLYNPGKDGNRYHLKYQPFSVSVIFITIPAVKGHFLPGEKGAT
jgi:hypothetical protein